MATYGLEECQNAGHRKDRLKCPLDRDRFEETRSMVVDLGVLAKADAFVGSLWSNVGRLSYELSAADKSWRQVGNVFRVIRQQSSTPIAMGELFVNQAEYLPLIKDRLIDFIRVHMSDIGGRERRHFSCPLLKARRLNAACACSHADAQARSAVRVLRRADGAARPRRLLARRHDGQRVAARCDGLDDFFLPGAEGVESEDFAQKRGSAGHGIPVRFDYICSDRDNFILRFDEQVLFPSDLGTHETPP